LLNLGRFKPTVQNIHARPLLFAFNFFGFRAFHFGANFSENTVGKTLERDFFRIGSHAVCAYSMGSLVFLSANMGLG
jgi:hypothetical protein